jgi:hypothetical protein
MEGLLAEGLQIPCSWGAGGLGEAHEGGFTWEFFLLFFGSGTEV